MLFWDRKLSWVREKKLYMTWEWKCAGNSSGTWCFSVWWFDMIHIRVFLKWATSKTWQWSFTPFSEAEFPGLDAHAEVLIQILGKLSFRDTTQKCHTKHQRTSCIRKQLFELRLVYRYKYILFRELFASLSCGRIHYWRSKSCQTVHMRFISLSWWICSLQGKPVSQSDDLWWFSYNEKWIRKMYR